MTALLYNWAYAGILFIVLLFTYVYLQQTTFWPQPAFSCDKER